VIGCGLDGAIKRVEERRIEGTKGELRYNMRKVEGCTIMLGTCPLGNDQRRSTYQYDLNDRRQTLGIHGHVP
jgi:hypothetical protein